MRLSTRYLPRPYPDELIYSIIARCGLHMGVRSPKALLQYTVGSRQIVASTDLQGRLSCLEWAIVGTWRMTVEQAVRAHTLLPYYVAYRTTADKKRFTAALLADRPQFLHVELGICAGTVRLSPVMRFCPACSAEDVARYGETYWRRLHQIPGVVVCPEHQVVLHDTSVPARSPRRHDFTALTVQVIERSRPALTLTASEMDLAVVVAQRSRALLDDGCSRQRAQCRAMFQNKLRERALFEGDGRLSHIDAAFRAFYGDVLIGQFETVPVGADGLSWLKALAYTT
ncbi:MAG: TniQ family protein [Pseudomonadota bacterium]